MKKNYIIVMESSEQHLENKVNEFMEDGYVPIGGVFRNIGGYLPFGQAMIYNKSKQMLVGK